tara:strand:- start:7163 stop:7417 length:255 start_codon:yes stop_codon:yes gene_type:complete
MPSANNNRRTMIKIDFGSEEIAAKWIDDLSKFSPRGVIDKTVVLVGPVLEIIVTTAADMALHIYGSFKDHLPWQYQGRCQCIPV